MDTAGEEQFNSIAESYYRKADCCLLVYDITSKKSFDKIKKYYVKRLKEYSDNILKVVLLGNKTDLKDRRQVSDIKGRDLALKNGYIFMESSCKDNYNVSDAFTTLVEMTNIELKKGIRRSKSINLNQEEDIVSSHKNKKGSCCIIF